MNNTRILIVGLGNKTLPNTRHNVGMMALDSIATSLNLTWTQKKEWKSDIAETTIRTTNQLQEYQVTFLKPRKFMNISGPCVAQAVKDLGIALNNLYIFHDDMQRDLGKVSLKTNGSANGHNGIKSVIDCLKSQEFKRIRIGIGRPLIDDRSHTIVADYVLDKFTQPEVAKLKSIVYPMWTRQGGLELLCDKGQIIKEPKKKNKHNNPNHKKAKKKEEWAFEEDSSMCSSPTTNTADTESTTITSVS